MKAKKSKTTARAIAVAKAGKKDANVIPAKPAKRVASAELDAELMEDSKEVRVKPDLLARIMENVTKMSQVATRIKKGNELIAQLQQEYADLEQKVLPSLMDEAGTKKIALLDDIEIERTESVYASIAKARMQEACKWFEANKLGALVKYSFEVALEKGNTKDANKVRKALKALKIDWREGSTINHQTLGAFVRESLEEGRKLSPLISVHQQPIVKLTVKHKK